MVNICLILLNLRSAENVGAIFRTASAVGVEKIYLTGYTPAPLDRFGRINRRVVKSALGAEKEMIWEKKARATSLISELSQRGFKIIALEQSPHSADYKEVKLNEKLAVIVGNEVNGIPKNLLAKCDLIAEIPMKGKKESLNVSVAIAVLLYRLLDR